MKKDVKDMTLEELIEYRRDYKMTEEEWEEQTLAIAAAELRHSGDKSVTVETMRAAVLIAKSCEKQQMNKKQS
ncbi:MAG: hypothetical protein GDA50_06110 [Alphaproteobacteria bacterium GM202ARS2]|nr:hypothetical protein [Alphaproteobacteria bacterium GM202ARS2]